MSQRVRSVVSGDTLVLATPAAKPSDGAVQTTKLTLAYVSSPRVSSPAGFAAREFLRKLLVAKPVLVTKLYANEASASSNAKPVLGNAGDRFFGDASSPVFSSLVEHALRHGAAELRHDYLAKPGGKARSEALETAQREAQQLKRGIWAHQADRNSTLASDVLPATVYGSQRRVPAIVENVLSGDRIVLRAMLSEREHFVGVVSLAGVRVVDEHAKKLATELIATRLLQRENVRCVFVAPAPFNAEIPLVTLLHPQGDIALVLVASGLAEVPNVPQIGAERLLLLRNAEQTAKQTGKGVHRAAHQLRTAHQQTYANQQFQAVVVRVLSADLVQVAPQSTKNLLADLETVQLSSVRAPRRNDGTSDDAIAESKDFARKLLIGQPVRVQIDGESTFKAAGDEAAEPRRLVTLAYGPQFDKNAALTLIRAGWATAVKHRRDDLMRSPFYDELLAAEEEARRQTLGTFKPAPKQRAGQPVYASETAVRARGYLTSLERRQWFPAVVDQTLGAGRLRLEVKSENCALMAVLDGVRAPRPTEALGDRALALVLREYNQREVSVRVRAVDKTGAFVAQILLGDRDLAAELLKSGLASVHAGAANAAGLYAEYDELEQLAKQAQVGMWENYIADSEPDETAVVSGDQRDESAAVAYRDAVISHVTENKLFVRFASENAQFLALQQDLQRFFTSAQNSSQRQFERRPRRRDLVVVDRSYRRALVTNVAKTDGNCFDLELIDTGAQIERVPLSELLPLPPQFAKIAGLAQSLSLKFVHPPVSLYARQYVDFVKPLVDTPVVVAGRLVYTPDSTSAVDSLNYRMIAQGVASVPVIEQDDAAAKPFLAAQEEVKQARRGMWVYGDPREDEDM